MAESQEPRPPAAAVCRRVGRLSRLIETRGDLWEWEVTLPEGPARAVAFPALTGPLRPGDAVLLNATAAVLALGSGGAHFVMGPAPAAAFDTAAAEFAGRETGHLLKLRYTPLQHRVLAVEDPASPHHAALAAADSLEGVPVLAAELHSQAAAAAIAAAAARPGLRVAWVQLDTAALPANLSRLLARLRGDGVVACVLSVGQAFGGDLEAVNIYSGLLAARAVAGADLIVVTQGPGNVGTGTRFGFSGLALAEALHAAATLGGAPVLAPRLSEADPRPRHRGLSHHTVTLLQCIRARTAVPLPVGAPPEVWAALAAWECPEIDPEPVLPALESYRALLTTMGRTLEQDPLFFRSAAAAGCYAAGL